MYVNQQKLGKKGIRLFQSIDLTVKIMKYF